MVSTSFPRDPGDWRGIFILHMAAALARVDAGTYGTCESCGRPVGGERLAALPETRYCIDCARRTRGRRPIGGPGRVPDPVGHGHGRPAASHAWWVAETVVHR